MAKDMLQPEMIKSVENKRLIARVVDVEDGEYFLRVQVRIQVMHPDSLEDKDLPWAEYALPPGNRYDNGMFIHVEPGDYVWVDFPYEGDVRRPRLLGSVHFCPEGEPNFPHEAWCGPDAVEHKRIVAPLPEDREYFRNNVFSQFGIVIEIVPNGVIVTQKSTGSAIEIHPEGDVTLHGERDAYMETERNVIIYAKNDVLITAKASIHGVAYKEITFNAPIIKLNCD